MSGKQESAAPHGLPDWHDVDADGDPIGVTVIDGKPVAMWHNGAEWTGVPGLRWAVEILGAWALHLRAVAAAERAYRLAREAYADAPTADAARALTDPLLAAEDALRALGVEP